MLRKTIQIDGIDVEFKCSAAVLRLYRMKFGRDMLKDMNKLYASFNANGNAENSQIPIEDLELFENVAYIMAYHANPSAISENVEDWLEQFNMFSIYEVVPTIFELWGLNIESQSEAKKNIQTLTEK